MYADVLVGQANNHKLSTYKQLYLDKELQFWQITFIVIVDGLILNSDPGFSHARWVWGRWSFRIPRLVNVYIGLVSHFWNFADIFNIVSSVG